MEKPTSTVDGLPPVTPPSGRFIIQLFVVPSVIVVVAVGILWGFTKLVGGSRTPEQFLKDLSNSNTEVRWRAASELAQVLKREEELATNPKFGLDLAELLRQALRDDEQLEKEVSPDPGERERSAAPNRAQVQGERRYVQYLINCLGNCWLPVGVPLLNEVAVRESGADAETISLRRQVAVWALALVGDRLKHLDQLPEGRREEILSVLDAEAGGSSPERAAWAAAAAAVLRARFRGEARAMGTDRVLAECARASDPDLRKMAAFALNIWDGSAAENRRMDDTLVKLSYDDGHGGAEDARVRGLEIRYKATEALARRGSPAVERRLGVLDEMLDEERQNRNFRTHLQDGRALPDETAIASTLTSALRAISELHRRAPAMNLSRFDGRIRKLAEDSNPFIRSEAERTLVALDRK